jgi:hypothetical protein
MTTESSDPGPLHRPPKLHPVAAFAIGIVCIPLGLAIRGAIGGGLVGGGIASILMGLWDTIRIMTGMVHKPKDKSADSCGR